MSQKMLPFLPNNATGVMENHHEASTVIKNQHVAVAVDGIALTEAPPPEYPDPNFTSSLVAKELNELSRQERERVFDEIHGVSQQAVKETTEFLEESLFRLQEQLDKIPFKPAYDFAMQDAPKYAGGSTLRLKFLRAKLFDPKKTAMAFVDYFEHKQLYFGREKLGRPIWYSDLDANDLECLRQGWIQVLPFRDKAGRAVLWVVDDKKVYKEVPNLIRCIWYRMMTMMEDVETQKNGIVFIATNMTQIDFSKKARETLWAATKSLTYLPIKIAAFHLCHSSNLTLPITSLILMGAGKDIRTRARIHHGTDMELQYSLMTFGIPVQYAPLSHFGELKVKHHRQWIKRRRKIESKQIAAFPQQQQQIIMDTMETELPRKADILLGKGIPLQQHTGNVQFLEFVERYKPQYEAAVKHEKKTIVNTIYSRIVDDNSIRFLEQNHDGWWVQISKEVACKKIARRLRLKTPKSPPEHTPTTPTPPSFLNQTGDKGLQCKFQLASCGSDAEMSG